MSGVSLFVNVINVFNATVQTFYVPRPFQILRLISGFGLSQFFRTLAFHKYQFSKFKKDI